MKIFQLMELLSKRPAGQEVYILANSQQVSLLEVTSIHNVDDPVEATCLCGDFKLTSGIREAGAQNAALPLLSSTMLSYQMESLSAHNFLLDQCCVGDFYQLQIQSAELYRHYKAWATENGHSILNECHFGRQVFRTFPQVQKKRLRLNGTRVWRYFGLAMKT